jgi:hypothetical protein
MDRVRINVNPKSYTAHSYCIYFYEKPYLQLCVFELFEVFMKES